MLIESMESDWDPARYHDTHREKVEALIEEKRQGHEIVIQEADEAPAKVVDLMEALNASIAAAARSGGSASSAARARRSRPSARGGQAGTRPPGRAGEEGAEGRQAAHPVQAGRPPQGVLSDSLRAGVSIARRSSSSSGRNLIASYARIERSKRCVNAVDLIRFPAPDRPIVV